MFPVVITKVKRLENYLHAVLRHFELTHIKRLYCILRVIFQTDSNINCQTIKVICQFCQIMAVHSNMYIHCVDVALFDGIINCNDYFDV